MAHDRVLKHLRYDAQQEAIAAVERMRGEESRRIATAQADVNARNDPDHLDGMILAELVDVVEALTARVEELEGPGADVAPRNEAEAAT